MTHDDTEEQPLDPVLERVRRKMIRLMVISISIMMIGLMAVLFAIVYKISNPGPSDAAPVPVEPVEINLGLPGSAKVLSTSVQNNRLVLMVQFENNSKQLIIIDISTGQPVSRININ